MKARTPPPGLLMTMTLAEALQHLGYSMRRLAGECGVDESAVRNWNRSGRVPRQVADWVEACLAARHPACPPFIPGTHEKRALGSP